jgi:hypothetical protein
MSLEKLEKIINFERGATGLIAIFPGKKEFTITFLLGNYYCTPKAHAYEIVNEQNVLVNIPTSSILSYSAIDSLGYNHKNLHLFQENLENEIKNLYVENNFIL